MRTELKKLLEYLILIVKIKIYVTFIQNDIFVEK